MDGYELTAAFPRCIMGYVPPVKSYLGGQQPLARGCVFLTPMDNVQRAVGYIDGFNLYHAIDDLGRPHLKWVDLRALVASFLRAGQELTAVNYYSAYATWMPDEFRRHRQYISAL